MKKGTGIPGAIPMKPYLHQFVQVLEGIGENESLPLTKGSVVAHTIKMALTYKGEAYQVEQINHHYSEDLKYIVPRRAYINGKMFLTASAIVDINQHIHKLLHEMLLQKIISYIEIGYTELDAIHDFMNLVGIEELTDVETLKKANYRMRLEKGITSLHENTIVQKIISFYPIRIE